MADIDSAILEARRRAFRHYDADGLGVLAFSLYALLLGFFHLLRNWTNSVVWPGVVFVIATGKFFQYVGLPNAPAMLWLKSQVSYRRTGFVALPPDNSAEFPGETRSWKLLKWAGLGAFFLSIVIADHIATTWIVLTVLTVGFAGLCPLFRTLEFVWLIIPSLWLSAWLEGDLRARETPHSGTYSMFIFAGLLFIVGSVRLLRFLRQNPAPPA